MEKGGVYRGLGIGGFSLGRKVSSKNIEGEGVVLEGWEGGCFRVGRILRRFWKLKCEMVFREGVSRFL